MKRTRRPSREIAALLADKLELAADERALFIQAARAELGADRLAPPVCVATRRWVGYPPKALTPVIAYIAAYVTADEVAA